jgi:hypothetical protein
LETERKGKNIKEQHSNTETKKSTQKLSIGNKKYTKKKEETSVQKCSRGYVGKNTSRNGRRQQRSVLMC